MPSTGTETDAPALAKVRARRLGHMRRSRSGDDARERAEAPLAQLRDEILRLRRRAREVEVGALEDVVDHPLESHRRAVLGRVRRA
jgi:hypothetical protein